MRFASALVFQTNVFCKPSSSSSTEVEGRILFWSPAEAASGGSFLFTWTKDTISISKSLETAEINFLSKLLLLYFARVTYTQKPRATSPALDPFICLQTQFHCEWKSTPSICIKTLWVPAWCMSSPCTLKTQRKLLTNVCAWDVAEQKESFSLWHLKEPQSKFYSKWRLQNRSSQTFTCTFCAFKILISGNYPPLPPAFFKMLFIFYANAL